MKIMGLDVGEKRIGVALSNEIIHIATNYGVIERRDDIKAIEDIKNIALKEEVTKIIYGLPLNMNGTQSLQGEKISAFIEKLKTNISIPVISWEERLTTMEAEKFLINDFDLSRGKRKKIIDKISAQLILQNYLDYTKTQKENAEFRSQNPE